MDPNTSIIGRDLIDLLIQALRIYDTSADGKIDCPDLIRCCLRSPTVRSAVEVEITRRELSDEDTSSLYRSLYHLGSVTTSEGKDGPILEEQVSPTYHDHPCAPEQRVGFEIPCEAIDLSDVLVEDLEDLFGRDVNHMPLGKRRCGNDASEPPEAWNRFFTYLAQAWTAQCRIGTLYLLRAKETDEVSLQLQLRWHMTEEVFHALAIILDAPAKRAEPVLSSWRKRAEAQASAQLVEDVEDEARAKQWEEDHKDSCDPVDLSPDEDSRIEAVRTGLKKRLRKGQLSPEQEAQVIAEALQVFILEEADAEKALEMVAAMRKACAPQLSPA